MRPLRLLALTLIATSCALHTPSTRAHPRIQVGAERLDLYLPLLQGRHVGVVANHSSMVGQTHLVDTLLALGVRIARIYSPEHGFRGTADAGEPVDSQIDPLTNIPIISLYGARRKPTPQDLEGIEVMLFDIQDVGVRFYTYTSTMHYAMEASAEAGIPFIVLDRPNPNGFFVDGPVLEMRFRSFVGMHPVPLVHGMTIGEYARMINGEGWLANGIRADLTVIPCANYTRDSIYHLPIRPSPNLPNQRSIYLYPSLGLFEGTPISVGRGTCYPFQIFGHPSLPPTGFRFTPESRPGASNPPLLGIASHGVDLRGYQESYFLSRRAVNLDWLIYAYRAYPRKERFFNNFFNLLAGNSTLQQQIAQGLSADSIRSTWQRGLQAFMALRAQYLLYPDLTLPHEQQ